MKVINDVSIVKCINISVACSTDLFLQAVVKCPSSAFLFWTFLSALFFFWRCAMEASITLKKDCNGKQEADADNDEEEEVRRGLLEQKLFLLEEHQAWRAHQQRSITDPVPQKSAAIVPSSAEGTASTIIGSSLPTAPLSSNLHNEWQSFFLEAGINAVCAEKYATLFVANDVLLNQVSDLNHATLRSLEVKLGDALRIFSHLKKLGMSHAST